MTESLEIYKCQVCGIVVEALDGGAGEPVCCGQAMELQEAKTADKSAEKHVPWVQQADGRTKVTVGQAALHPMEEKHYIQWIEVLSGGKAYRQFLKPGQQPEAVFEIADGNIVAREFCNLHGLWKGE